MRAIRTTFEQRYFPISIRSVASFLCLWLFTGFALGTILLLGPVRKIVMALEDSPSKEVQERIYVILIIVFLIASTLWLALRLTRTVMKTSRTLVKFTVFAATLAIAFGAYLLWVNPKTLSTFMSEEETVSARFTFGPYPNADRLEQLKGEGYTGVVSLLHPAVIPFEPQLIARERNAAAEAGIRFIHIPMLPWVSGNEHAMSRIRDLVQEGSGRYYVHCYLGEDRVQLFRRFVERIPETEPDDVKPARRLAGREMARGFVVELEEGVYVTPFPVPQEFEGLIIFSNIRNVVALLDPENPDDAKRIAEEKEVLGAAGVAFTLIPIGNRTYSADRIMKAVETVRTMQKPVVVHSFHSVHSGKAAISEAFVQAYLTGRRPLPPSLFNGSMTNGPARVVAPGVSAGPIPTGPEFGSYLRRRGIRTAIHVGPVLDSDQALRHRAAAAEGKLEWLGLDGDPRWWTNLIETLGPVYLYGPGADAAATILAEELGPPLPGGPGSPAPVEVEEPTPLAQSR